MSFSIPCGLKRDLDGRTVVWVRSPRTNRTLEFNERCQSGLPERVMNRIVQAAAQGARVAEFSTEELQAMAELHRQWLEAVTPRSGGYIRPSRSMSARY